MDETARYNRERWEELASAGVRYTRPRLDLDLERARALVDPLGLLGPLRGRRVLCLAGGGGQQSAAFGLLGARVTVLDLSPTQLERDRVAARHYGLEVRTVEGDMRDLSGLPARGFHVVHHAHALPFVPDALPVFGQVARVLRRSGIYRLSTTNPAVHGVWKRWDGSGYRITEPYVEGARIGYDDDRWEFTAPDGTRSRVRGPAEYRHTLETVIDGPLRLGLRLIAIREDDGESPPRSDAATPGSWEHFWTVARPYLTLWFRSSSRRRVSRKSRLSEVM